MGTHLPGVCLKCGEKTSRRSIAVCGLCNRYRGPQKAPAHQPEPNVATTSLQPDQLTDRIRTTLKTAPKSLSDLAGGLGVSQGQVLDRLLAMEAQGVNVQRFGELWSLEKAPNLGSATGIQPYRSRPNGTYRFGWLGDTHLGSKYERLDVLTDLYRRFASADIDRIFHGWRKPLA